MRSHNQINQVCQEIDAFRGFDQKKSINIHVGYLFNNARPDFKQSRAGVMGHF